MLTIRLFISSPGDVGEERVIAERVIERLGGEFGRAANLQPYFWEHEPLRATQDFQAQILSPADCDIVACILWARIGTRLPDNFNRPDGSAFRSGTEWEFETAADAYRKKGIPDLLAYRKTKALTANVTDEVRLEEQRRQYRALEDFVARWFEQDGAFKAAFKTFDSADQFEKILEGDLRKLIQERLRSHLGTEAEAVPEVIWFSGSPFRGLAAFDYEHRRVFFGRTRAIGAIKDAMVTQAARGCAFVQLFGASGVGKSSLVRAGVIPTITQPGVIEGIGLWRWCAMRPSDATGDIFDGLASAILSSTASPELESMGFPAAKLAALFREAPARALAPIRAALTQAAELIAENEHLTKTPESRLAIVIDQMEEVFTLDKIDASQRAKFVALLSTLARSGIIWVIGTMRSDFYARCAEIPDLLAMQEGSGQYRLQAPSFDEVGQMITWPARAAGLSFEHNPASDERLDAVIHEAASKAPEALPLLEFTLDELYKRRAESNVLTLSAYRELGGLEGALARRAEEEFSKLSPEAQAELPAIFRALVTIQQGAEEMVVGRRVPLATLETSAPRKTALKSFIDARLLVSDEGTVALAHEALLRHWGRLADWIESDKEMLRTRSRVAELATLWRNESKRPDLLLQPGRLLGAAEDLLAIRRADLDDNLIDFIRASAAGRLRRQRIRRLAVAGVCVVAVVTSILAVVAYRNAQQAKRASELALARQLSAQAGQVLASGNPELAALLAVESLRRTKPPKLENDIALRSASRLLLRPRHIWSMDGAVQSLSFSLDGRYVAAASWDKTARVFEAASGREVSRLDYDDQVVAIAFSPDGRHVATASGDTVLEFEAASGREVWHVQDGVVTAIAFSPDGRYLAASWEKTALVFEAASGREISRLVHGGIVNDVAFSPDGLYVATGSNDKTARVFEASSGHEVSRLVHDDGVETVTFSPDGRYVATGSDDKTARVFEASSGREVSQLVHGSIVNHVAFSRDGRYVATGSDDSTARVFEASSGREVFRFVHDGWVRDVAFSPDGRYVATGSDDKTARVFEVANGRELSQLVHGAPVKAVRFSPDGRYLATGSDDGTARVFEATSGREVSTPAHGEFVYFSPDFKPDGRYVATANLLDRVARVFDVASGREVSRLLADVGAVAFSSNGRYVATGGDTGTARVFDAASGREVSHLVHDGVVWAVAFSPDGRYVATASDDKTARVFEATSGREVSRLVHDGPVNAVAFSPDGRYVATGSDDKTARVFEAASGREVCQLVHDDAVNTVAFSPDAACVATLSKDKTARVFEVASRQEMFRVNVGDVLRHLVFSHDGQHFAAAGGKGIAVVDARRGVQSAWIATVERVLGVAFSADGVSIESAIEDEASIVIGRWPATPDALVADACSRVTRNLTPAEWKQYVGEEPYRKTCPNLP